jgi:hypothetical protein
MAIHSARRFVAKRPHWRSRGAAARVAVLAVVSGLALLVPVPVAADTATPIIFNARDDFRVSPNQANPSGPWRYRQTGPGRHHPLLDEFWTDHFGMPGLETWHGQEGSSGGEKDKLPWVGVNTTSSDVDALGIDWPAGALLVHPGHNAAVMIVWRSPKEGLVRVRATVIDRDDDCGDGVRWSIRLSHRHALAAANIPNGGSAKVNEHGYPALGAIDVDPGSRIELRIGIGPGGTNSCDSTQVRLTITLWPGDF